MRRSRFVVAAAVAAAMGAAGCQAAGADKAGTESVVLRLASIDPVNDNGQSFGPQAFIDNLATVSGGRVKAEVITDYGDGDPQAETNLVKAIASGDLDGGWPATRAFAGAGITGLAAVEAPMTITSYAAEKALVSEPVATKLLATLDGSGVVGLGLAVGPLRRPFAAQAPLLAVEDWKGVRFRSFNSPVQSQAITALGATPVNASVGWIDQVREGTLRGAEFDLAQYAKNGYGTEAGNVTSNVVLWPKVFVLSLSRKRFDSLTQQQQTWMREAAGKAVQASVAATYDENTLARKLCAAGVHFQPAGDEQVAGVRAALQPTLDRLAADLTSGPLLRQIQAIAAQHPQPDVPNGADSCRSNVVNGPIGAIPATKSALPDGVYRVAITITDATAGGFSKPDDLAGTWTLTVKDGRFELTCRANTDPANDCGRDIVYVPVEIGDLRGSGHTAYFLANEQRMAAVTGCQLPPSDTQPGHCGIGHPYRVTWTLSGDTLTLSDYRSDGYADDQYLVKPWRKIG